MMAPKPGQRKAPVAPRKKRPRLLWPSGAKLLVFDEIGEDRDIILKAMKGPQEALLLRISAVLELLTPPMPL